MFRLYAYELKKVTFVLCTGTLITGVVGDPAGVPVVTVDRFYTALFSALEQTHCARMWFYMSD